MKFTFFYIIKYFFNLKLLVIKTPNMMYEYLLNINKIIRKLVNKILLFSAPFTPPRQKNPMETSISSPQRLQISSMP